MVTEGPSGRADEAHDATIGDRETSSMTTIRTSCNFCGDVELVPGDLGGQALRHGYLPWPSYARVPVQSRVERPEFRGPQPDQISTDVRIVRSSARRQLRR